MPSRLTRFQKAGDIHFITFSCHDRLPHLATPAAPELFEDALERMRRRYVFHVFGYVIMPEHVHLLISEPGRGMLDHAIQALKTSVSKQSVQRPFWLARYYDFNVHSEEKRVEKLRYIHRNPVHRGLVERPEDWQWSNFRHYATGERGTVEIESFWTAALREKTGVQMQAVKDKADSTTKRNGNPSVRWMGWGSILEALPPSKVCQECATAISSKKNDTKSLPLKRLVGLWGPSLSSWGGIRPASAAS